MGTEITTVVANPDGMARESWRGSTIPGCGRRHGNVYVADTFTTRFGRSRRMASSARLDIPTTDPARRPGTEPFPQSSRSGRGWRWNARRRLWKHHSKDHPTGVVSTLADTSMEADGPKATQRGFPTRRERRMRLVPSRRFWESPGKSPPGVVSTWLSRVGYAKKEMRRDSQVRGELLWKTMGQFM